MSGAQADKVIEVSEERTERSLNELRMRLVDASADLRPLPSPAELRERVLTVAVELDAIRQDLMMVLHIAQLEQSDVEERLVELDKKLATGWRPSSRPVEDVVADLRQRSGL